MFIATTKKKNIYSPKVFEYQQLFESVRTPRGPRKRFLLNLGKLDLERGKWTLLSRRIEEIATGQESLIFHDPLIEELAQKYSHELIKKQLNDSTPYEKQDFADIDVSQTVQLHPRQIGAEYIGLSYLKKLELHTFLKKCNLTARQIEITFLLIIGRMVHPTSERGTHLWARYISGLDELMGTDFRHLSLNSLYPVSDALVRHKEKIEEHLVEQERNLFSLDETIILYDLTNTFFEGVAAQNKKAKFGRSKEKRSDCRLVTLGLVIDSNGFPKRSRIFPGNQSEPETLFMMIDELTNTEGEVDKISKPMLKVKKPTVVIDAGIATEENLERLRKSYHYICVSRKKMCPPQSDDFLVIRDDKKNKVEVQYTKHEGEIFLYCKTTAREQKERAIQSRSEQYFEAELVKIAVAITKKGGIKNYQKVCERIGRARQKYSRIAHYYDVFVEEKDGLAVRVTWTYTRKSDAEKRFSGSYYLRTDRMDLTEKEIWKLYSMLVDLEDIFLTMKSEIGIRPNFHQKENRCDGHIFITLLAYHVVNCIRTQLKDSGIRHRWSTIRKLMSTHQNGTVRMRTKNARTIYIRKCMEIEPHHKQIYDALALDYTPGKTKKWEI